MTLYPCGPCTRLPRGQYCSEKCRAEQNYFPEIARLTESNRNLSDRAQKAESRAAQAEKETGKLRKAYSKLLSEVWALRGRGE